MKQPGRSFTHTTVLASDHPDPLLEVHNHHHCASPRDRGGSRQDHRHESRFCGGVWNAARAAAAQGRHAALTGQEQSEPESSCTPCLRSFRTEQPRFACRTQKHFQLNRCRHARSSTSLEPHGPELLAASKTNDICSVWMRSDISEIFLLH